MCVMYIYMCAASIAIACGVVVGLQHAEGTIKAERGTQENFKYGNDAVEVGEASMAIKLAIQIITIYTHKVTEC